MRKKLVFHRLSDIEVDMFNKKPLAFAQIKGDEQHPDLTGYVKFYPMLDGTLVEVYLTGLPIGADSCEVMFHGFHIHEGSSCTGNAQDPFADAGLHFNPQNCQHPEHAGDMPAILANSGVAWMAFYTNHFLPTDVIGRTVIVHSKADDYHTQPSGNSGQKIGCGSIVAN